MTQAELLDALRKEHTQVLHQRENLQPFSFAEYRRLGDYALRIEDEIARLEKKVRPQ
jgi:hypothetical protein